MCDYESRPVESSFSDTLSHLSFDLAGCRVLITKAQERRRRAAEGKDDAFPSQRDALSLQTCLPGRLVDTHGLLMLQMSEVLLSLPQSSWSRTCVHAPSCYVDNDIPLQQ